ncbi:MAG: carboxylating nicotinate-nucleotide diphosphorylase [Clostridiales bacterium]|nr:carboxylating nicotinate-nucleotide diphosphorylase [Clostridiales bacterium]
MMQFYIDDLIKNALLEDVNYIDTTADYLLDEQRSTGRFLAKADGVLCGLEVARRVFTLLDPEVTFVGRKQDGDRLQKGEVFATVTGKTAVLLKGERTALNLLQHMSGIATATAQAVELVKGTRAMITDTRKTLPGLRPLQKYAVVCGGGRNHRFNLSDGAMLKDNHIDAAGGIAPAVEKLRGKLGHMVKLEVETRNLEEVAQALKAGADVIMLDNMDCDTMRQAVELTGGRALLEASGGITAGTLRQVAETGVDIISIGALTHSVTAFDISMKIQPE